ncbi:hypothetical protein AQUCO_00400028v1 [Aquilegia coerulea]|uniref:DUF7866 domain-containing protein n=1 Tax=Aquilegia coerulea TaxID=218851 RepID=A0A2G5ET23_AQUCA|nr:hypothetical protein AQUCO_00400028v1 [Aquilegia coerulea]
MYISINKISAMVVLVLITTKCIISAEHVGSNENEPIYITQTLVPADEPVYITQSFEPVGLTKGYPILERIVADHDQNGKPFKQCLMCRCCPDGDRHSRECVNTNCCYGFECRSGICTFKPLACNCINCSM